MTMETTKKSHPRMCRGSRWIRRHWIDQDHSAYGDVNEFCERMLKTFSGQSLMLIMAIRDFLKAIGIRRLKLWLISRYKDN